MWCQKVRCIFRHSKEIGRVASTHGFKSRESLISRFNQSTYSRGPRETVTQTQVVDDNGDTFGLLAEKHGEIFKKPSYVDVPELLTKNGDDEILALLNQGETNVRHDAYWYMQECMKLGKQRKIYECVQMLLHKMLKVDHVQPKSYNFGVVIGALGRVGHAEKAFEIYNKMLDYRLKPELGVYTGLFNAVGNSSNPEHIKFAKKLYEKLKPNKNLLNSTVYNALLKAYARHCTTHVECFVIFQDMLRAGKVPDHITFLALMDACGKDRESGFLHALQVWRQMLTLGIQPTAESLTVFLRICYQCGIGDSSVATRTLLGEESKEKLKPSEDFLEKTFRNVYWQKGQQSFPRPKDQLEEGGEKKEVLLLNPVKVLEIEEHEVVEEESKKNETIQLKEAGSEESATEEAAQVIGLLKADGETQIIGSELVESNVAEIGECRHEWDRLQLVGGHRAVLDMIVDGNMRPNTQTFMWLAKCCQPDFDSELELLKFYCRKEHRMSLDVRFFNTMMERRAQRRDYEGTEQIFRYLKRYGLKPDHYTFKVKAMNVANKVEMLEFLDRYCQAEENELGLRPDVHVYNRLYSRIFTMEKRLITGYKDAYALNYDLLKKVMESMLMNNVSANKWTLSMLERARNFPHNYHRWSQHERRTEREVKDFRVFYNDWLKRQKMTAREDRMSKYEKPTEKER